MKRSNVKQRKTGREQGNSVISQRAREQERAANKREGEMSEMEGENLVMNEGVKETGCRKERGKDRGFTRPDP